MLPYDAHTHLHFNELKNVDWEQYFKNVSRVSVNGTHPDDWESVADMTLAHPDQVIPQFGIHPWKVKETPNEWEHRLRDLLKKFPIAGVGEIGLDKWIKDYDLALQKSIMLTQIEIANEFARPVTIHCLKAWGTLKELLLESPIQRGFLLHAYSGPAEWIEEFAKMGAYFSFSPYFLYERKAERLTTFKKVPLDRLLIETDAPAMLGPPESWSLEQNLFSKKHQHPNNIRKVYERYAEASGIPLEKLTLRCRNNFLWLFRY